MSRGGYREGAGRPKSGRKVRTIRATDEEWKLIKAYAEQVKAGKLPEKQKPKETVIRNQKGQRSLVSWHMLPLFLAIQKKLNMAVFSVF